MFMSITTKEANKFDKESVYLYYIQLGIEDRMYENVTRTHMLKLVFNNLSKNPDQLINHASENTLSFLKEVILTNKKVNFFDNTMEEKDAITEAEDGILAYYDYDNSKLVIPEMIKQAILDFKSTDKSKHIDEFYSFLDGLLQTRGIVSMLDVYRIYFEVKPDYMNLDFEDTFNSLSRFLVRVNIELLHEEDVLAYEFFNDEEELPLSYNTKYLYTWEMYLSIAKYGLNRLNPELEIVYQTLTKTITPIEVKEFVQFFSIALWTESFEHQFFIQKIVDFTQDINESMNIYNSLIKNLPNIEFSGDPLSHVDHSQFEHLNIEQNINLNDGLCPCGSGKKEELCCSNEREIFKNKTMLDQKTGQEFFFFLHFLLYKINIKYNIVRKTDLLSFMSMDISEQNFQKLVNLLYMDKDDLNLLIKDLDPKLKKDNEEFINGYNNMISGDFIAVKYIKQKLLVMNTDDKKLYLVSGLSHPLSFKLPSYQLPQYININLIPLKNMIVYDSTFSVKQVALGPNIRKMIEEDIEGKKYISKFSDIK